jgi:hypothetical protein
MKEKITLFNYFYAKLLSVNTKKKTEIVFVSIAIVSFILHLALIALVELEVLESKSKLLTNPIAAIYTPFSFILIYEVYLLVYYLPKSTTIYIGKQYEIITLIIIRRTFKDLSHLKFNTENYFNKDNFLFAADLVATVILFYLIYIFYKLNKTSEMANAIIQPSVEIKKFIDFKKIVAMFLIPLFLVLSVYSLGYWIYESFTITEIVKNIKDINKIFFAEFFTVLILVEVLLLLVSFFLSDKFSKVIRNSGFIISTILIKLSFTTEGILNTFLIVVAVLFGVLILMLHNKYEVMESKKITKLEL